MNMRKADKNMICDLLVMPFTRRSGREKHKVLKEAEPVPPFSFHGATAPRGPGPPHFRDFMITHHTG
jgi:hypothetical protein